MKKILPAIAAFVFALSGAYANVGDTIVVNGHNKVNMTWYGNYDDTTVFPPATKTYQKILMHYYIGCATGGCSGWDYTTIVEMLQHTGIFDSTVAFAPGFTVNGSTVDSVVFDTTARWQTFYDTLTRATDSIADTVRVFVRQFSDTTHPYTQTDSLYAYTAGFWNYYYDTAGNIIDSAYAGGSSTWVTSYTRVYTPYEVLQPHEMGRVITPYGSYYTAINNWSRDYVFDVTDYAPLLHDTVILRDFYSGYSSGFSVTLVFQLIEGTPPRPIKNIHPLFNGYFAYGSTSDPIANHLSAMTFATDSTETRAMFRITPTGHGEGSSDNCDEFCDKTYDLYINQLDQFTRDIWRDDCGLNPLMHQSGTWIYNRANWCPGWFGQRQDYELPAGSYTPGDSLKVQVQMEPYTEAGGGAGLQMAGELFTYGNPNQQVDATIDDIIQPTTKDEYVRFNPVCANPKVVVRNLGANDLTSVNIHYGILGSFMYDYAWSGYLSFNQSDTVTLPNIILNDSSTGHTFQAFTYLPNGQPDDYPFNDTARTYAAYPPVYDSVFIFNLETNLDPTQNNWWLTDDGGDTLYSNDATGYVANHLYRDTFHLPPGCFNFTLNDKGGDGLDFNWANGRGVGYAQFRKKTGALLYTFQPDFGSQIGQSFMVGAPTLPPSCQAKFTLYPDSTNSYHWYALNQSYGTTPVNYSWNWGDSDTSSGAYPTHTYTLTGNYNICLSITDASGCSSSYCDTTAIAKTDTTPVTVNVVNMLPAGIGKVAGSMDIKIYPNPTKGNLSVNISLPAAQSLIVQIYNSIGQLMSTRTETGFTSGTLNYDLSGFASDIYYIKLTGRNQSVVRKVVLQR